MRQHADRRENPRQQNRRDILLSPSLTCFWGNRILYEIAMMATTERFDDAPKWKAVPAKRALRVMLQAFTALLGALFTVAAAYAAIKAGPAPESSSMPIPARW